MSSNVIKISVFKSPESRSSWLMWVFVWVLKCLAKVFVPMPFLWEIAQNSWTLEEQMRKNWGFGGEEGIKTKIGVCIKDSAAGIQEDIASTRKGKGISV